VTIVNRQEALEILGEGHSVWSVEAAKKVCENVGVPWSDFIAAPHYSVYDRGKYNIYMQEEGEITVMCQDLTDYVMNQLGVQPERFYHGRGTQAKDNAEVIAKELERREQIKK